MESWTQEMDEKIGGIELETVVYLEDGFYEKQEH